MTCIVGAVCKDGIVLVGDKKVKAGQMTYYENKITPVEKYESFRGRCWCEIAHINTHARRFV